MFSAIFRVFAAGCSTVISNADRDFAALSRISAEGRGRSRERYARLRASANGPSGTDRLQRCSARPWNRGLGRSRLDARLSGIFANRRQSWS